MLRRFNYRYDNVDEIPLEVSKGISKLAIEVAGYNCSSFYTLPIKSFLCAEVLEDGVSIKYTSKDFKALSLEKIRSMYSYRYSHQRAYGEVWNFDNSDIYTKWNVSDDLEYDDLNRAKICGSLNHGFASFAGVALVYALSGISMIDYVNKKIYIDKKYLASVDFSLKINTCDGFICISKTNDNKEIYLPDNWLAIN